MNLEAYYLEKERELKAVHAELARFRDELLATLSTPEILDAG